MAWKTLTEHASSGTVLGTIPYQKDVNDYSHKLHIMNKDSINTLLPNVRYIMLKTPMSDTGDSQLWPTFWSSHLNPGLLHTILCI